MRWWNDGWVGIASAYTYTRTRTHLIHRALHREGAPLPAIGGLHEAVLGVHALGLVGLLHYTVCVRVRAVVGVVHKGDVGAMIERRVNQQ